MSATNPTRVGTSEVRLSYANIFEAKSIQGGKPKYSVSLIIPKPDTETLAKIERAIDAAIDAAIGKFGGKRLNKAALKLPLCDGDIERDDEAYAHAMFVNANSTTPPQVVGTDLQPILDAGEVYSGLLRAGEHQLLRVQHEWQPGYRLRAGEHPEAA
jgi:phage-associated protein